MKRLSAAFEAARKCPWDPLTARPHCAPFGSSRFAPASHAATTRWFGKVFIEDAEDRSDVTMVGRAGPCRSRARLSQRKQTNKRVPLREAPPRSAAGRSLWVLFVCLRVGRPTLESDGGRRRGCAHSLTRRLTLACAAAIRCTCRSTASATSPATADRRCARLVGLFRAQRPCAAQANTHTHTRANADTHTHAHTHAHTRTHTSKRRAREGPAEKHRKKTAQTTAERPHPIGSGRSAATLLGGDRFGVLASTPVEEGGR